MAEAKLYTREQVQAAQKMLRGLAAKKSGKTKGEVVDLLAVDICKAVGQGHSVKDIQEALGKTGIPVPLSRLKTLLEKKDIASLQNLGAVPEEKDTAPAAKKEAEAMAASSSKDG